jgi:hypothetical protein
MQFNINDINLGACLILMAQCNSLLMFVALLCIFAVTMWMKHKESKLTLK